MTLTARVTRCIDKKGIQIKNGDCLQHQDYTRKSQKVYRRRYGAFCGFLKDSNLPSIEKDNEVLMHHEYQKCF